MILIKKKWWCLRVVSQVIFYFYFFSLFFTLYLCHYVIAQPYLGRNWIKYLYSNIYFHYVDWFWYIMMLTWKKWKMSLFTYSFIYDIWYNDDDDDDNIIYIEKKISKMVIRRYFVFFCLFDFQFSNFYFFIYS